MNAKNSSSNTTAADVAAQAAEEKLVTPTVPAQGEGEKAKDEEKVDLTVIEGGKKTVKGRLTSLVENVKGRKEFLFGALVGGFVASVTVVKLAKERVETVIVDEHDDENSQIDPTNKSA